jgi:TRAP transporter TAXI family solute receptor
MVEIPATVVDKIGAPYGKGVIPKGTYNGQTADVPTAIVRNYLVTRSGLSADTVYAMTKALFEHLPELAAAHSAAKGIQLQHALEGMPIALHPGAERYYKEKGLLK